MTVKELVTELLEYDTDSEVEIAAYSSEDYDTFSNFDVENEYKISGKDEVFLNFGLEGVRIVDSYDYEELKEEVAELREKQGELEDYIEELEDELND